MDKLKSLKFFNRGIYFRLPLLLMLLGLAVRAAGLGAVPGGVNQDEAMAAYDAYSLSLYGCDRFGMHMPVFFTAWGYGQMSVLMSYLMVPFIKMFGFNIAAVRLPSLLVSVAGLWVVYLFVRDMLGRGAGCAALFAAAVNPWQIMQSRWALDCNMFPHFVLFAVYALYVGVYGRAAGDGQTAWDGQAPGEGQAAQGRKTAWDRQITGDGQTARNMQTALDGQTAQNSRAAGDGQTARPGRPHAARAARPCVPCRRALLLSMFFFAMCMYTYGIAFYAVPLLLAVYAAVLLAKRLVSPAELLACAGVFLLFAWPALAVVVINYFHLPSLTTPLFTAAFFPEGRRMSDLLPFSDNIPAQFVRNFVSLADTAFLQRPDLPWNTIPEFGPLYLFSLPVAALGAFWLWRRKTGKAYFLLVWLCVAAVSGLITDNVNVNRVNIVFYPLVILCGVGVRAAASRLRGLPAAGLAAAYALAFVMFVHAYFGSYAAGIKGYFFADFLGCLSFAEQLDPDVYFITADVQRGGSAAVPEILTLFAQKTDPAYFRGDKAPGADEHWLTYSERYIYAGFSEASRVPAAEGRAAVYVVNAADELNSFPAGDYDEVYRSGGFCVMVPAG
ncbi:MAG: glycosyltransferase family 39 protein [Firmicutes bacterium]|nr:glycosyltransferase family 39 protein [Bacillota bacterium]